MVNFCYKLLYVQRETPALTACNPFDKSMENFLAGSIMETLC